MVRPGLARLAGMSSKGSLALVRLGGAGKDRVDWRHCIRSKLRLLTHFSHSDKSGRKIRLCKNNM